MKNEIQEQVFERNARNFDFEVQFSSSLASITLGSLVGWRIGRVQGLFIGSALTIIDEFLIYYNYNSRHYVSSFAFSAYVTKGTFSYLEQDDIKNFIFTNTPEILKTLYSGFASVTFSSFVSSAIIAPVALSLTYYFDDFLDFKSKLEVPLNSFLRANKFFDSDDIFSIREVKKISNKFLENPIESFNIIIEDIKKIYYNPYAFNFIMNIAFTQFKVLIDAYFIKHLADYEGKNLSNNIIKDINKKTSTTSLIEQVIEKRGIIYYVFFKSLLELCSEFIRTTLEGEQVGNIVQKATDITIEYGDKIIALNPQEGIKCLNSLIADISKLSKVSQEIFKIQEKTLAAVTALISLQASGSNLLFFYLLSAMPKQALFTFLFSSYKELAERFSETEAKKDILQTHIINHGEQISLRNAKSFMNDLFFEHRNEFNLIRRKQDFNKSIKDFIDTFTNTFGSCIDLLYYIIEKNCNTERKDAEFFKMFINSRLITTYVTSVAEAKLSFVGMEASKFRLNKMLELINFPEKRAKQTFSETGDIIFNNYTLYFNETLIVEIPSLKLESGKRYAVTGKSGCGKSSVLKDLYKGNYVFESAGEIIRPENIIFLDQKQYQPPHISLLELIYFPRKIKNLTFSEKSKLEKDAIELLEEFEIDNFISNSSEKTSLIYHLNSNEYQLSGGQFQKVTFIQVILAKATHIICDECTTALDLKSLILAQKLIKKYLPNITFIGVNHHADADNYDQFYELELHFENRGVTLREISSKSLDFLFNISGGIDFGYVGENCVNDL